MALHYCLNIFNNTQLILLKITFIFPCGQWVDREGVNDICRGSSVGCYNLPHASKSCLKLKSHGNFFKHNNHLNYSNSLQSCTKHGSITATLCVKFQNDWTIVRKYINKCDLTRFEFKWIFPLQQQPLLYKCCEFTWYKDHHIHC